MAKLLEVEANDQEIPNFTEEIIIRADMPDDCSKNVIGNVLQCVGGYHAEIVQLPPANYSRVLCTLLFNGIALFFPELDSMFRAHSHESFTTNNINISHLRGLYEADSREYNLKIAEDPTYQIKRRAGYYTYKPIMDALGTARSTGTKSLGIVMIYMLTFIRAWHNPIQIAQETKILNRAKAGLAATIGNSSSIDESKYCISTMIAHYHSLWKQFHIGARLKIMHTILSVGSEQYPKDNSLDQNSWALYSCFRQAFVVQARMLAMFAGLSSVNLIRKTITEVAKCRLDLPLEEIPGELATLKEQLSRAKQYCTKINLDHGIQLSWYYLRNIADERIKGLLTLTHMPVLCNFVSAIRKIGDPNSSILNFSGLNSRITLNMGTQDRINDAVNQVFLYWRENATTFKLEPSLTSGLIEEKADLSEEPDLTVSLQTLLSAASATEKWIEPSSSKGGYKRPRQSEDNADESQENKEQADSGAQSSIDINMRNLEQNKSS